MKASERPFVHIVDDDASFRQAIGRVLQTSGYQVALFESGRQYLDNLPPAEPGCILLDLRMTGLGGLELQESLSKLGTASPIIFLTGHGDIPTSVQAIKGGADDFLTKPVSRDLLIQAIERAFAKFEAAREQRTRLKVLQALVSRLTARESEVFALVVRGRLNKQIAHALGTSERTIKAHRHSIMQKLEVRSLAKAVSIAERLGMLGPGEGEPTP
jgi:FixJ family two-component response regulator